MSIPIFPLLCDELKLRSKKRKPNDEFVFPEQAQMYQKNPDGITWRVQKVLAAAGFRDDEEPVPTTNGTNVAQISDASLQPLDQNRKTQPVRGTIHIVRKEGLRRASIRDFHSFRVTWVTLALTAGAVGAGSKSDGTQNNRCRIKTLFSAGTGSVPAGVAVSHAQTPGQRAKISERGNAGNLE